MNILGLYSVAEAGLFDSYRQDKKLKKFRRVNVIYGPNGSGKSSLSRIFKQASDVAAGAAKTAIFEVGEFYEGATSHVSHESTFPGVLVFSDDFIERNHRFNESKPNLDAILTLGEKKINVEAQLDAALEAHGELVENLRVAEGKIVSLERDQSALLARVSASIVDNLSRVDGYRSRSHYSSGTVKDKFGSERSNWEVLDPEKLLEKLQIVQSEKKEEIDLSSFSVALPNLEEQVTSINSRRPLTTLLDTLSFKPEAAGWVEGGRKLHVDSEECLYCGGRLTAERRAAIEAHFNEDVTKFQFEIDKKIDEITEIMGICQTLSNSVPDHRLTFEDLQKRYVDAAQMYSESVVQVLDWLQDAKKTLLAKRANVMSRQETILDQQPKVRMELLAEVVEIHNERTSFYAEIITETAKLIEQHHLASEVSSFDSVSLNLATQRALVATLRIDLENSNDLLASLKAVDEDPVPSANKLTSEVTKLLGRGELRFISRDGKYEVYRNDLPAIGLSKGERTAIALVHFLETVANFNAQEGLPIIVVDDPVSSLDANVFMGVSSRLWNLAMSQKIAQFFLLTHNFDLFKQWDLQLEGLGSRCPHLLMELRVVYKEIEGKSVRRAKLVEWPESPILRDKVRSTYHHNFMLLVNKYRKLKSDDTIEARLDAMILMPNVIRRVLETFLAFKQPESVGNFSGAMRNMDDLLYESGYRGDAPALRQTLYRFSNAYSHDQSPETDVTINSEEIRAALFSVFTFMHQLDREHFNGLCSTIHVDPADLIGEEN